MDVAPFADMPITVSLQSITAMKYRMLNCTECGQSYMERNNDAMYSMSKEVKKSLDNSYHGTCPSCSQQYRVYITTDRNERSDLPLYLQPQTIYLVSTTVKQFRDTHCHECGKTFHSISDRISSIVDNITPLDQIEPDRLGPMEARCKSRYCSQRWYIRV